MWNIHETVFFQDGINAMLEICIDYTHVNLIEIKKQNCEKFLWKQI